MRVIWSVEVLTADGWNVRVWAAFAWVWAERLTPPSAVTRELSMKALTVFATVLVAIAAPIEPATLPPSPMAMAMATPPASALTWVRVGRGQLDVAEVAWS